MKVDFKITTWERVEIPEENKDEVFAKIKDGTITSANDLFDLTLENGKQMDLSCNKLIDVDEQMTVEENGGCSTIEVLDEDENFQFTNAKDS
jgi:hypothetical protein